jgi:pantothenate synthetase
MSSRNLLLTDKAKENASNIYKVLLNTKNFYQDCNSISQSISYGKSLFRKLGIKYDYLDAVDENSFMVPNKNSEKLLLITAGYIENIRLIDNLEILK